jgi:hypothetical protein
MSHQRVILNPLRRFTRGDQTPHDGIPPTWDRDDLPALPDGQEWFEIHNAPNYDPATQRVEQVLDPVAKTDGWRVVDLTPEEIAAKNPVPKSVTRRQLLLVLASLETPILPSMIEAMIGDNQIGLIEFQNAGSFERSHPLVAQLATALDMTPEDVDNIFRQASKL